MNRAMLDPVDTSVPGIALWVTAALCTAALCTASPVPPSPRAPTIDGVLAPGEWEGARVESLVGGGELLVLPAGDSLFVAVRGESPGIAHLCLASAEEIRVLHASAALGAARYAAGDSAWRLREGFVWELRDAPQAGPPTAEEIDAFFSTHGWVANPSHSGVPLREFRIVRSEKERGLAAAHLAMPSAEISVAGAAASDGCGDLELVRGDPPVVLDFEPDGWLRIESSSSSKARAGDRVLTATSPLRQSFDMRVPVPPTPVTVAGMPLLVYELHLTNFAREPLIVQRVEVLDADGAAVIADLRHDALDHRLDRPGAASTAAGPRTIAPGEIGVVYLELSVEDGTVPRALEHRVAYHVADEDPPRLASVQGGHVPVRTEPPVVLAPPLRGGPWAAVYFSSRHPVRSHRRVLYAVDGRARIPGRFAIDWVLLDAAGRHADGNEDVVANWYGYGVDVLAVADGVVVAARDDIAESATLSGHPKLPLEDATGNYVTLDLGGGRYAAYEHLEPGSVRVTVGEHVRRGQVIGSIGFTGHSMGPHLHFHVADANSPLGAEGLPFVLDAFRVLGSYDDFEALDDVPWTPHDNAGTALRTEELPAPNVVVEFAGGARSAPPSGFASFARETLDVLPSPAAKLLDQGKHGAAVVGQRVLHRRRNRPGRPAADDSVGD